jgi:hypothetical protein
MYSSNTVIEILWVFILALYGLLIIWFTKRIFDYFLKKGLKKSIIVYYNRKIIHILAGGIIVLAVPIVFSNPIYPLFSGVVLTIIMFISHKTGHIFYWFQTDDNINDVSFCFMWAVAIFILWTIFNDPWVAIIPPAFIAFGDGITGMIRNIAFEERRKHPVGNIYMAGVCIPIGYYFANLSSINNLAIWGVIAALVASVFERYEFGPIDDNILITVSSTIVLYLGSIIGALA